MLQILSICENLFQGFYCLIRNSLDKLQNNSDPVSVTLTDSLASTPQSPNCITAIIWKVTLGCKTVLSPFNILKVCSPQSGGYPIPIEYPVLESFLILYLSKTTQNYWATSSTVLPGYVAAIPASNASLVAFIVAIFFWSFSPNKTVRAIGQWYLL